MFVAGYFCFVRFVSCQYLFFSLSLATSVKNKFWFFESTLYKRECYNLLVWFLVSIFIESCTDGFKSWFINKRIRNPSLMTIRVVKCTRSKDQLFCNFNGFYVLHYIMTSSKGNGFCKRYLNHALSFFSLLPIQVLYYNLHLHFRRFVFFNFSYSNLCERLFVSRNS